MTGYKIIIRYLLLVLLVVISILSIFYNMIISCDTTLHVKTKKIFSVSGHIDLKPFRYLYRIDIHDRQHNMSFNFFYYLSIVLSDFSATSYRSQMLCIINTLNFSCNPTSTTINFKKFDRLICGERSSFIGQVTSDGYIYFKIIYKTFISIKPS